MTDLASQAEQLLSAPKPSSQADIDRHQLFRTGLFGQRLPQPPRWSQFIQIFQEGYFCMEGADGFYRLQTSQREIIPLPIPGAPIRLPRAMRRFKNESGYTVSTDRVFDDVMHHCSIPRRSGHIEDCWIRDGYKQLLRESRQRGFAHTIEVWKDGELVGGVLGLKINCVFTSLSVFSNRAGAGNAAYIELHQRLLTSGFMMHDCIVPSNISRTFGGCLIPFQQDFLLRRRAQSRRLEFPLEPAILPPEQFPHEPQAMKKNHGRPFTR